MAVTLYLTSGTSDVGLFNIYTGSLATVENLIASNVTRAEMIAGYCTNVDSTIYTVQSATAQCQSVAYVGAAVAKCDLVVSASLNLDCDLEIDATLNPTPTPTPVPVPTPTPTAPTPTPTAPTPTPTAPTPTPTAPTPTAPTPTPTPSFTDGWRITAASISYGGSTFVGLHRGTLVGCPSAIGHGGGSSPTTSTTSLPGIDCYDTGLFPVEKGYGVNGIGNVSGYALTQFDSENGGGPYFGIINTSGTGNPGGGSLSGTITGTDGSSGTWSVSFSPGSTYTDNNGSGVSITPESTGTVSLSGLTLTSGVTYTINT